MQQHSQSQRDMAPRSFKYTVSTEKAVDLVKESICLEDLIISFNLILFQCCSLWISVTAFVLGGMYICLDIEPKISPKQELRKKIVSKKSICWEILIISFLFLVEIGLSLLLTIIPMLVISILCTLLRDQLKISPAGWKKKSYLEKLVIVMKAFVKRGEFDYLEQFFTNMCHQCSTIWRKATQLVATSSYAIAIASFAKDLAEKAKQLVATSFSGIVTSFNAKFQDLAEKAVLLLDKEMSTGLKTRIDELEEKKHKLEQERIDLSDQLFIARDEIRGHERKHRKLEKQAMFNKEALESAEAKKSEYYKALDRVDELEELLYGSTDIIDASEEIVSDLRREMNAGWNRETQLKEQLEESMVKNEALEDIMCDLRDQVIAGSKRVEKLEESLVNDEAMDDMEEIMDDLRQQVLAGSKSEIALVKQLEESRVKNEALEEIMCDLRNEVIVGCARETELVKQLDESRGENEALEEVITSLRRDVFEATSRADIAEDRLDSSREEASILGAAYQHQLVELNETMEELEIQKNELDARLTIATGKLAHFQALSTELEAAKAKLEDEKNELNAKLQMADESAEYCFI